MSAKSIIEALRKMTRLHEVMNSLAKQKTEFVKKGDIDSLRSLLKEENKQVQEIRQTEALLMQDTHDFLEQRGVITDTPTLSKVIEASDEKGILEHEKEKLEEQIEKLKQQNQLNQDLLAQSLQFVQMSLDVLQPNIESYNYNRSDNNPDTKQPSRSIFDSNA